MQMLKNPGATLFKCSYPDCLNANSASVTYCCGSWASCLTFYCLSFPRFTIEMTRAWQPTPVFLPGESHRQRPGGLQSLGSQKVIYNWSTLASKHLKRLSFPYCILGLTINWPFMHGFTSGHSILFHWFMCLLFFVCLFVLFCFMPMLYYFGYCSFVIWFEFKACNASMFVLLSQVCCGYLGIFMVPNKF